MQQHVQQDEEAFRKYEEEDRQRREELKKFQEEINSTRETNAKLKMDQVGNREWDSIKQAEGDGFSDGGGRRGGRDRWSKNEKGGASDYTAPDWANEPAEGVNNWGDAPVGGDISQWRPAESSGTEKADGDNDETKLLESHCSIGQASPSLPLQIGLFLLVTQTNPRETGLEMLLALIKIGQSLHLKSQRAKLTEVVEVVAEEEKTRKR
jgi:hypothetical protein